MRSSDHFAHSRPHRGLPGLSSTPGEQISPGITPDQLVIHYTLAMRFRTGRRVDFQVIKMLGFRKPL